MTLRNAATGEQAQTTTGKNGTYHLEGLAPGSYILEAVSSTLGQGSVDGIYIAPGHEARILAAVALSPLPANEVKLGRTSEPAPLSNDVTAVAPTVKAAEAGIPAAHLIRSPALPELAAIGGKGAPLEMPAAAPLKTEIVEASPELLAALPASAIPAAGLSAVSAASAASAARGMMLGAAAGAAARILAQIASTPAPTLIQLDSVISTEVSTALTRNEIDQLPMTATDGDLFAPDAAPQGDTDAAERRTSRAVRFDGASTALAFGARGGGNGATPMGATPVGATPMGLARNQAAIQEVKMFGGVGSSAWAGENSLIESRQGVQRLHGHAFVFDKPKLWGARNPLTPWVKETAPAIGATVPVFDSEAYSPRDRQMRWSAGFGDTLLRGKIGWFTAFSGEVRGHPAVSTVRHPENFFVQPSNDEMQMLASRLGLSGADPVANGVQAYSKMLETLAGLLGPAARTSLGSTGSARIDWRAAEHHRFTFEGNGADWNSTGGGLTEYRRRTVATALADITQPKPGRWRGGKRCSRPTCSRLPRPLPGAQSCGCRRPRLLHLSGLSARICGGKYRKS